MTMKSRKQILMILAVGGIIGFVTARSQNAPERKASAAPAQAGAVDRQADKQEPGKVEKNAEVTEPVQLAQSSVASAIAAASAAVGQNGKKPNILFIMGDDIGFMQPGCYHRGLMVGETPNIDRLAREGGLFMDYYAMQSCTSGRCAFFTGIYPVRVGLTVPQLPGSPAWLRPGTPTLAKTLLNLGYSTGQFGKNHLGDHAESLPTAQGFQE